MPARSEERNTEEGHWPLACLQPVSVRRKHWVLRPSGLPPRRHTREQKFPSKGLVFEMPTWGELYAVILATAIAQATLAACATLPAHPSWRPPHASRDFCAHNPVPLRLRGGRGCTGTRNSCKQRKYHMKAGGVQRYAKRNHPIALSHKPCSGPWALSKVERAHGAAFIQQAMWQGTPRSNFHDPRTAALRHGLRWNKYETNTGFKVVHKDLNHCLLKACLRGLSDLVPGLVQHGADINFIGQNKTGLSPELVGATPIRIAAHQGWPNVVEALLALGADPRGGLKCKPSEVGAENPKPLSLKGIVFGVGAFSQRICSLSHSFASAACLSAVFFCLRVCALGAKKNSLRTSCVL